MMHIWSECRHFRFHAWRGYLLWLWTARQSPAHNECFPAASFQHCDTHSPLQHSALTHWDRDKMDADDIFKWIFLNENVWISIKISLKFVPHGSIYNIPALVQMMAWRRPGDKPLSGPMMVRLPTYICVTWPQWVKPACWISVTKVLQHLVIYVN